MSGEPTAEGSIDIAADAQTVYALLTDLDVLAELADEAYAMTWTKGASAAPGNVFAGRNRNGKRTWTTSCTVTDAVPGSSFAFRVTMPFPKIPVSSWRYEITATGTGCRVTESTHDERPGWFRKPAQLATGVSDRDAASGRHIAATLERLRVRAEGDVPVTARAACLLTVSASDAVLYRIEALPGEGRYAVTFRRGDGGEQTAVAQLTEGGVEVAESALPVGWTLGSDAVRATLDAVLAVDAARRVGSTGAATLRDVDGGWDVGLGNVVLGGNDTPRCTAHGDLVADGDVWTCPECGARALYT